MVAPFGPVSMIAAGISTRTVSRRTPFPLNSAKPQPPAATTPPLARQAPLSGSTVTVPAVLPAASRPKRRSSTFTSPSGSTTTARAEPATVCAAAAPGASATSAAGSSQRARCRQAVIGSGCWFILPVIPAPW